MIEFYHLPRSSSRFNEYLNILIGRSGDMKMPIPHFNPMAKEHIINKLSHLKALHIEEIASTVIEKVNSQIKSNSKQIMKVSIALADDVHGGWTNLYATDYSAKFDFNGYHVRNFCTVVLYASQTYTKEKLERIIEEYCHRSYRWSTPPVTLEDHIKQEIDIAQKCMYHSWYLPLRNVAHLSEFYQENRKSENPSLIFNFFYGDKGSRSLGYQLYGIQEEWPGFKFCTEFDPALQFNK